MEQNIYEALDWLFLRVKKSRLSELAGRTPAWLTIYQQHRPQQGTPAYFSQAQVDLLQKAWDELADQISVRAFLQVPSREQAQNWAHVNEIFLSKFFHQVLGCPARYFENRCRTVHTMPWTEDEILRMNAAIQATAQQMRQTRLVVDPLPAS